MIASASTNWFFKSKIPTTFYLIREQCSLKSRGFKGEKAVDLLNGLNNYYLNSSLIIIDMKESSNMWKGARGWSLNTNAFSHNGVIFKERYYPLYKEKKYELFFQEAYRSDMFQDCIRYATCTMSLVLFLSAWFQYETIIFVGVDLYDHRYFWLKPSVLRELTKNSRRKLEDKHFTADVTIKMVSDYLKVNPSLKMYTHNPKSLLANIMPVWKI